MRFGRLKNGGYILFPKALKTVERIYSYGVDINNVDFDVAITKKLKVNCHCYGCSLEDLPQDKNFLIFHKEEIGARLGTFSRHVMDNGDQGKNILLKVDLEGWEWDFLEVFTEQDSRLIPQIVIEFHGLLKPERWPRYANILKKINRYYYLCYVQATNTSTDGIIFDGNLYLHNRYGATFLRKDLAQCSVNRRTKFPTKVDYPNLSGKPYISLDGWPYRSDKKSMFSLLSTVKTMSTRAFFKSISR